MDFCEAKRRDERPALSCISYYSNNLCSRECYRFSWDVGAPSPTAFGIICANGNVCNLSSRHLAQMRSAPPFPQERAIYFFARENAFDEVCAYIVSASSDEEAGAEALAQATEGETVTFFYFRISDIIFCGSSR